MLSLSTFNFDNFTRALKIFVVLVLCFEAGVSFIPEELSADVGMNMGMEIKNKRSLDPGKMDVVVLGDCFFFAGTIPHVLDTELDVSSFNFATNRSQTYLISYLLFKRILNHANNLPRLVIVGVHDTSLFWDLSIDKETLRTTILPFFNVSFDLLAELPLHLKTFTVLHQIKTMLPSLKKQYLLRENWPDLWRNFDSENYFRISESIEKEKGYANEDLGEHPSKAYDFSSVKMDCVFIRELNDKYIRKILDLAQQHGVKAILVSNSYRRDLATYLIRDSNYGFDIRYYEKLRKEYPNVLAVFNMHAAVPDPERYVDETHLDNKGAMLFTRELARRLKPFKSQSVKPGPVIGPEQW